MIRPGLGKQVASHADHFSVFSGSSLVAFPVVIASESVHFGGGKGDIIHCYGSTENVGKWKKCDPFQNTE